ncbi:MAG TPA: cytochrome c oxidase subunit II [Actinomycetota bacterium]|nr:cytochrome c oxidase subunit II [Actinomycetota bacterium]
MTGERRTARRALRWGVALSLLVLLSACARNAPQDALEPAGPYARQIDTLFNWVFWTAAGVFFLVEGLLVYAAVRFRHRPGRPTPVQVHGNPRLEIAWTIAPAALLAAIAVPTILLTFSLSRRPADALDIEVVAHQFWWEVRYPNEQVVTANEVHIPVGRPVFVRLTSVDVIHSFWIPRLAGKQDVRPGAVTHLTLQAEEPGTYLGQCAEYCGLSHANMRLRVVAQPPDQFRAWVDQQRAPVVAQPSEAAMAALQRGGCAGCHTLNGVEGFGAPSVQTSTVGPDLTHVGSRQTLAGATLENTPEQLAAWLRDPQAMKPGNDMVIPKLTEQEVEALVAYLESLK